MWRLFTQRLHTWLRLQCNNNPLLFDWENYFGKLGQAVKVWVLALIILFGLAILGCAIIIIGSLNSWF